MQFFFFRGDPHSLETVSGNKNFKMSEKESKKYENLGLFDCVVHWVNLLVRMSIVLLYFTFTSMIFFACFWQTLSQMLCESRAENKALKKDLAELRQLYRDSQEDIQLLHDVMAKQKNRSNSIKAGDGDLDPRQDLIAQLEKNQEKVSS